MELVLVLDQAVHANVETVTLENIVTSHHATLTVEPMANVKFPTVFNTVNVRTDTLEKTAHQTQLM